MKENEEKGKMGKRKKQGMVQLVGAGCGGFELLTLKALNCIKNCQVLIYDSLVDEKIVSAAPEHCEKIYVGKRYGKPSFRQPEINRLLCLKAGEGKRVVRLKGGDPFVFGRGGEEAECLIREGVPFQVVPGISSCVAVPELAGIPVTHRDISRGFYVITARTSDGEPIPREVLKGFAFSGGTLVVLMGLSLCGYIAQTLMEYGVGENMPAAVISKGGGKEQRVFRTVLKELKKVVEENGVLSPAVIVIGNTAGYDFKWGSAEVWEEEKAEAENRGEGESPLKVQSAEGCESGGSSGRGGNCERGVCPSALKDSPCGKSNNGAENSKNHIIIFKDRDGENSRNHKRVLITGSEGHTEKLGSLLDKYGIYADKVSLTKIVTDDSTDNYTKGIAKINKGCYTIFTSPNGVDVFFRLLRDNDADIRMLWGAKVAAVGSGTCQRLKKYGIIPDLIPNKYTVEELANAIAADAEKTGAEKKTAVAFRSQGGSEALGEILTANGFDFSDIKTYRIEPDKRAAEDFQRQAKGAVYSRITFSSASGVRIFFGELESPGALLDKCAKIVCIGAETARELDGYKDVIGDTEIIAAKKFSCEGLAEAVADSLRSNPEQKEI